MITLNFNGKTLKVQENDSSYRYRSLMAKPQLVLKFSLPEYVEIPVGAWCEFMGKRYYLPTSQNIKKHGKRNIDYTLTMVDDEYILGNYKFRNVVDGRLKWSMCAKPIEFLKAIVACLNERDSGWSVGSYIDATEKTIEFNHSYLDEALQDIADTFGTEWAISGKVVSLGKVEYFKDSPLALSYGKGNGFIPGVGRSTLSDEQPIKRVYVQGGEKNIDRSKYGSPTLLLPKNKTLEYEGRTYITDADGLYIERYDKVSDAVKDESLDCSEIYPSRIGKVSSVEIVDAEKNFYDFTDNSIPEELDFNDYIIEGETPHIRFQSGMLSGEKDFEFKYIHKDEKGNAVRRFELVPQEIDGQTMPNTTYAPGIGDTYVIFGIMLPDSYICNDSDKTGASWDMFREGARFLYEHEDQKFTFHGELQALWAKRNWVNVGGKLIVGGYVLFSDEQFAPDGVLIRITGIKEYLTSPYSPTIEISNSVAGKSFSSTIRDIDNTEIKIEDNVKSIIAFTKRRFRDAKETMLMLEDAMLNFSGAINPITVQTMAALVGDESLQFRFVASKTNLTKVAYSITYDQANKQLHCPHGYLQHMTLGINTISSQHKAGEYKVWEMNEFISAVLAEPKKKYYLYAKVSSSSTATKGNFVLSETAIEMNAVSGYYHLLTGVLNSEYDGERSYVDLYGFTEILPGRITTDKIVSSDGDSFFDMVNNAMRLGNVFDFNTNQDGKLRLKGTIVQNEAGDENVIGCYRGVYDESYVYYNGDEVSYFDGNFTSTYRCISITPIKGIAPTDSKNWEIIAQGSKGDKGDDGIGLSKITEYYLISDSLTGVTTSTSGWSTEVKTPTSSKRYLWNYEMITYSDGNTESTTPQVIGMYSEDGRGIKSITEYYARSTSNSVAPTSWSKTPPTLTSTYKYMWNYEEMVYTDDSKTTTTPAVIGVYGDKGDKGDDGIAGDYYEYRYAVNGSTSTAPSLSKTSRTPSGWSTSMPSVAALEYLWMIQAKISGGTDALLTNWSTPVRITPYDGNDGKKGDSPAALYQGVYSSTKTYFGNSVRIDIVKYNDEYFVARTDAGTFSGKLPTNTSYWNSFGASFESVATVLLLAEMANIANLIFKDGCLISQLGEINGERSEYYESSSFVPALLLDSINGCLRFGSVLDLNRTGLDLFDANGYSKLKIYNGSVGAYDEVSFQRNAAQNPLVATESIDLYVPYSGSYTWSKAFKTISLGFMDKGSVINISSFDIGFTVPKRKADGSSATFKTNSPAARLDLYRGTTIVKSFYAFGNGTTSGNSFKCTSSGNISFTVEEGEEGVYKIVVSAMNMIWELTASGNLDTFLVTTNIYYTFSKINYERTIFGSDGQVSVWGNGYMFQNSEAFVVRYGSYLLKVSASGIQKSTNSGNSWTNL